MDVIVVTGVVAVIGVVAVVLLVFVSTVVGNAPVFFRPSPIVTPIYTLVATVKTDKVTPYMINFSFLVN